MAKKRRVRILMDSQHVKRSEKLLKSARQYFCHLFWSPIKKINSENFVLVVSVILRLFVNILAADDKFSLSVKASVVRNQYKWNHLKMKKYFLDFFLHLRDLQNIWNTLNKKISLRRNFFLKLKILKGGVT